MVQKPIEMTSLTSPTVFPVDHITDALCANFSEHDIILSAPPGAGKSTRIPIALLNAFPQKRFIMLQPRRVVVRHLAQFLAKQRNEKVGQSIGYRIRGESRVSQQTQLTIVTEGVLTRLLQDDPELSDFDGVIFDEFHERSVHADLGLAFALECQQQLRPDLRIMIMSATLDIEALKQLLPQAKSLHSDGKMFPVDIRYLGDCRLELLNNKVVDAIEIAVRDYPKGDVLVFLPSAKHIRWCASRLQHLSCQVFPLYGALSLEEQSKAIVPAANGNRKIILATNIAETSLTIEGVTVVIDSGREQQAKFDSKVALTSLTTKMVSQPSTVQRMGRAGRMQAGVCFRLWANTTQERLHRTVNPEIKFVDFTPYLLDVLAWGSPLKSLALLDQPDPVQLDKAWICLRRLGLVNDKQQLTAKGRDVHQMSMHPRVASMLFDARSEPDSVQLASAVAACLVENAHSLNSHEHILEQCQRWLDDSVALPNKLFKQALAYLGLSGNPRLNLSQMKNDIAIQIARAYPERVAFQQQSGVFKLAQGPRFNSESLGLSFPWCVLLHGMKREQGELLAFSALSCEFEDLKNALGDYFQQTPCLLWNEKKQQLDARLVSWVGDSQYASETMEKRTQIDWASAWLEAFKAGTLGNEANTLPFDEAAQGLFNRIQIAQAFQIKEFEEKAITYASLIERSDEWLIDALANCRSLKHIQQLPWKTLLLSILTWPQQQSLSRHLPETMTIATGQQKALDYQFSAQDEENHIAVHLNVKLQAMFGINQPLSLCNGQLVVTVNLLSPAGRPIQTTKDLGSFWQGSYVAVAKEMRGRYPKHPWPDNPAVETATLATKKHIKP